MKKIFFNTERSHQVGSPFQSLPGTLPDHHQASSARDQRPTDPGF